MDDRDPLEIDTAAACREVLALCEDICVMTHDVLTGIAAGTRPLTQDSARQLMMKCERNLKALRSLRIVVDRHNGIDPMPRTPRRVM